MKRLKLNKNKKIKKSFLVQSINEVIKPLNMVYDSLNVKSPFYVGEDEKLKNVLKIDRLNNPYNAISLYVLESFGYTEGSDFGRIDVWQENRKLYWSLREKEVIDSLTEKRSEYNVFS